MVFHSRSDAWPVDDVQVGEAIDWACAWCQQMTSHIVRAELDPACEPDDSLENSALLRTGLKFALAECARCSGPLLVGWQSLVDLEEAEPDLMECVQLFPSLEVQGIPDACPPRVRTWLNEAHLCRFASSAASVLLTRKAIEGICADHGFTGNLSQGLKAMRQQGFIDARLWSWSDLLRQLGNDGAHNLDSVVTLDDAEDALWFARELIHQTYVVQPRFDAFSRRRATISDPASLRLVKADEG